MDSNPAASSSSSLIRQPTSTSTTSSISLHPSSSFAGSTSLLSQRILTEEQYQSSLDYIIKRDFFPTLARQQLEQSYLSALQHGDETEIRDSLIRLVTEEERMGLVGVTPRGRDSQSVTNSRDESVHKRRRLDQSTIDRQTGTTTPLDTPLKSQTSNWESTPISSTSTPHHHHHRHSSHSSISQSIENQAWKEQGIDLSLSLSQFQSRYTSEDNASFNSLMARNNLKKREKNSWAFEVERKANEKRKEFGEKMELESKEGRELMLKENERRLLLLQDDKGKGKGKGNETKLIEMAKGKGKEKEQEQEGTDLVLRELEKDSDQQLLLLESTSSQSQSQPEPSPSPPAKDDRPSIFQSTKFKALNNFFFSPDSDISTNYSRNSSLPLHSSELASVGSNYLLDDNLGTSATDRPEIARGNIRLPKGWNDESGKVENDDDDDDKEEGGGSSPSSSRIDRAIAGNITSSSSSTSSRRGSQSQSLSNLINSTKPSISLSTPRIAGYSFVSPLPTPRPGDLGEDRIKQLMTWGQIVGTPRRVDETPDRRNGSRDDFQDGDGDDEGNGRGEFFIPNTPKRDELARKLSNPTYHSKHKYNTSSKGSTTPYGQASYRPSINLEMQSPRQSSIQNLSPAARNLFDKSIRKSGSAGGGLFGNARDGDRVGSKGRVKSSLGESLMRSRNEKDRDREVIRREREKDLEKRRLDLSRKGWSPSPSPRPN